MFLNSHSCFSLKYGTLSVEEVLRQAVKNGASKLALTDINNTSGCLELVRRSGQTEIQPVLGIDFRNGVQQHFVGLAKNNEGFADLNRFLSAHLHSGEAIPDIAPNLENAFVIYPFEKLNTLEYQNLKLNENSFIGVQLSDLSRLRFSFLLKHPEKLVLMHSCTFVGKRDFNAHRLLRAIANNTLLSKLPLTEQANPEHIWMETKELERLTGDFSFLTKNAERLLNQCSINFDFSPNRVGKNPKTYTGTEEGDLKLIRNLCQTGLKYRYPNPNQAIHSRIEKELDIIRQKGFISYFLINWDITRYAADNGYFYIGRGSGANSIVAYLLQITDVDPIELDLYFERFINLYRQNPPDFDIDFSWKDRDNITRYIFEQFPNTALLATYITFKDKSVIRELGKVFGLPKEEIDLLSEGRKTPRTLDEISKLVLNYGKLIQNLPSHLSIHSSGIVISGEPIHNLTATWMPPKGFATTQFDMEIAEDVGLFKFDILSQRGLGKIKDAVQLVSENQPDEPPIDIHDIKRFKEDNKIKALLSKGKAIGCFYVESPAMRMLLSKLRVDNYMALVAASSIIRPGVAKSGMMREYILRYRNPERRKDAHPVLLDIMPDTFGVMVYQEDVIKVAHYFGGLSLVEADMLRRGMSGKFRSRQEFAAVRERYFESCREQGHPTELSTEIWRQIESFAGYAFAKGHSASYAVESYQSLFLKAGYPLEYMVATLNNGGGYYRPELYVHEARMNGAVIHPPEINLSQKRNMISGKEIFLGFGMLTGFEDELAEKIACERIANGPYENLDDFIDRTLIDIEQLSRLIRIDAFRGWGINKKVLLWKAHQKLNGVRPKKGQIPLFKNPRKEYSLPQLSHSKISDIYDQIELLGFPICNPFDLILDPPEKYVKASQLHTCIGKVVTIEGYLITIKSSRTSNGKGMYFGTFIDYDGYFIDTVHFPPVAQLYRFSGRGVYKITGKVVEEFDYLSLEVERMEKFAMIPDPRFEDERIASKVKLGQGKIEVGNSK
jgi:DNA polymerase-3 subunit alpha